jgi:hypothetical protein
MRLICSAILLPLMSGPVLAEWDCRVDLSYQCDKNNQCERNQATPRVTIYDEKMAFRSCLDACEDGAVTLRRNFFGSTYRHEKADKSSRIMMRSRSGEYNEHTTGPDGKVTSVGFGSCAWR